MRAFPLTFRHSEFDPGELARLKESQRTSVSVCLPARDEEQTVGAIVTTIRRELMERVPLVDEIVVLDDDSTDSTVSVAAAAGARVVTASRVLPEAGLGTGKGEVMWKSLYAGTGDLVCWLDADIRNFNAGFVSGLLGPLLTRSSVDFVKGYYHRPIEGEDGQVGNGGRVTELVARPLICRLFPHLDRIVQPLAGEYGGRRELLETLPFVEGWGVELGLLIDVTARRGLGSIAQVDLGTRVHHNRPLFELAPQAMAIITTALRRAGISEKEGWGEDLVRFDADHRLEHVAVELSERPPMIEMPAYRAKFGRELTA